MNIKEYYSIFLVKITKVNDVNNEELKEHEANKDEIRNYMT